MIRQYVLSTADADQWRQVLPAEACVMGSLEYLRIVERQMGFSARLFVVKSEEAVIAYPFLVRPIATLPFVSRTTSLWSDTSTPEYTGPLRILPACSKEDLDTLRFPERFEEYCHSNRIITEFAHLSPWHAFEQGLDSACVVVNRNIVHVDLTLGETGLWNRSLTSDTRRQTRQAEKAGVRVRRAVSLDDVREFHRLYTETMARRNAFERYRYPLDYFAAFFETMPDNSFFVLAEYQNRVIAGGLFLHDSSEVYWHLSAADLEFSRVRPVNKLVWDTMVWAAGVEKKRMLFGGGYREDDGIFRFKAGFSPLRTRFCTYHRIHDHQTYQALADAWSEYYRSDTSQAGFFPLYRSAPGSHFGNAAATLQPEIDQPLARIGG